jgi:hypothetical protein
LLAKHFASEPPATIFVSNNKRAHRLRLWRRGRHHPIIYDPRDTAGMLEMVKEPPPVLVIGTAIRFPISSRGSRGARPAALTHEDFGDVWRIKGRSVTRSRLGGS